MMTLVKRSVTGQDEYGNDIMSNTYIDVYNCAIEPAASSENLVFTDQVSMMNTIFMPAGTPVEPVDAIIYAGETFEVFGTRNDWTSPFSGRQSPIRVTVNKIEGVAV